MLKKMVDKLPLAFKGLKKYKSQQHRTWYIVTV